MPFHHRTNVLTHPPCFTQAREKGALPEKLFFPIALYALGTAAHVTLLCGPFLGFSFSMPRSPLKLLSHLVLFHSGLNALLSARVTCQLHQGGLLSLRYHRLDKLLRAISTSTPPSKPEGVKWVTKTILCLNCICSVPEHDCRSMTHSSWLHFCFFLNYQYPGRGVRLEMSAYRTLRLVCFPSFPKYDSYNVGICTVFRWSKQRRENFFQVHTLQTTNLINWLLIPVAFITSELYWIQVAPMLSTM